MYNEYSAVVVIEMLIIGLLAIFQRGYARRVVAGIFAISALGHNFIFGRLHDSDTALGWFVNDNPFAYYFGAGLFCFVVIYLIAKMKEPPELGSDIQYIALLGIFLNLVGWLMELSGFPKHGLVNSAFFMLLYGIAIVFLTFGEPKYEGNSRVDTRLFAIRSGNNARFATHKNH